MTGAGDTVVATMALALAAGGEFRQAAELASLAAGRVVRKVGTATVRPAELRDRIATEERRCPRPAGACPLGSRGELT